MNILIVFDSFFGNTEKIAEAMGAALQSSHDVKVVRAEIASEQLAQNTDVVIVGSPTIRWQATESVMDFLKNLPENSLRGKQSAAFDTRILADAMESGLLRFLFKLGSYATKPIAKSLNAKGSLAPVPAAGFYVTQDETPKLEEGELQRAEQWAVDLFK
jgi:flavodoxin I